MEKVQALMIFEVLGKPPEYVKEALDLLLTRIGSEKGVKILNKNSREPIKVENSKDLFTAFTEVELEVETIAHLLGLLFAYMPANVEVIKPEKLAITNVNLNELTNMLVHRLHDYDAITKKTIVERDIIKNHFKIAAPEQFNRLFSPQSEIQQPVEVLRKNKKSSKKKSRYNKGI